MCRERQGGVGKGNSVSPLPRKNTQQEARIFGEGFLLFLGLTLLLTYCAASEKHSGQKTPFSITRAATAMHVPIHTPVFGQHRPNVVVGSCLDGA